MGVRDWSFDGTVKWKRRRIIKSQKESLTT